MTVGTTKLASNLSVFLDVNSQEQNTAPSAVLKQFAKLIGAQPATIFIDVSYPEDGYFVSCIELRT